MEDWKRVFDDIPLQRGKTFFLNKRVDDLEEVNGGYTAAVLGRERFPVMVKLADGRLGNMSCSCPVSRMGRNCEHMAAVLYAIEAREEAARRNLPEETVLEIWKQREEALSKEEEKSTRGKRAIRRGSAAAGAASGTAVRDQQQKQCQKAAEAEAELQRQKAAEAELQRQKAMEEEREARRQARELRKAEMARKKEEQRRLQEEAKQKENEKRLAEEARREQLRQQKKEEARRREEKRRQEEEKRHREEEKRRREEEKRRQEEEKRRREEEKRRQEEEKRRQEEEKRRQEEGKRRQEEEKRCREEARRQEEEKRRREEARRQEEYELLGEAWSQEDTPEAEYAQGSVQSMEQYHYYDGTKIRDSVQIPQRAYQEGEELLRQGRVKLQKIISGYDSSTGEILGQANATGSNGREEFRLRLVFSRTQVKGFECGCPKCRRDYYIWNPRKTDCPYKAGLLREMEEYLNTRNVGDATDRSAQLLFRAYRGQRAHAPSDTGDSGRESLQLVPRLLRKDGELSVSFKVGEHKLFVVKKLDEFCENVRDSATVTYGTSTHLNHSLENFTEKGKVWIRFINRIVGEEETLLKRIQENRYYSGYRKSSVGGELSLFGWRLDEFYQVLGEDSVEYEERSQGAKQKSSLTCRESNPEVTLRIAPEQLGEEEFHGVEVSGKLPQLYVGIDSAYYISAPYFCRVESGFLKEIEPLAELVRGDTFSFRVGRNHLSEFYYRVLPRLKEVAQVVETEPEKLWAHLLPDVRFVFYLDAEEQNVTCRICARYGEKEIELIHNREQEVLEPFRDVVREEEVLDQVMEWLPEIDWEQGELHCGGREELIYQMMESGTEKLLELGEVRCTRRFMGYRAVRRVKVSVGVSVASDLLELTISTEDVPESELLDILASYRARKKYYRLKDGSFVNLEDSSLDMLTELMDTTHIKPKELVKGKMKLPMYRTLYLDKMLEEHEDVYSSRDSRFREMVKGFKTVNDADFEEPESLSRVMRKYQKNGYKWLRTLENWQFGGILADDMGLGKTLQVIAVLLAAREEDRGGTSLVVTPASLVFNWGEELARFAPKLAVSLITGTQEERQEKLAAWQEADVLVTSYDLLKRDIALYEEKDFFYEIIDEAQYIKNHTTAAAKAVKVVRSRIRYALTGTPIENRLSELWSIFDYLMPGFLFSYEVFKRELETPIVKNGDEAAIGRLQKMVGPFILRRRKEDVLKDLPKKLEESRYVRFEGTQQKLYDAQVLHMRESLARQDDADFNKNKMLVLAELTRLRQICCDPSLCFENYRGESAKLEACLQLIQSAMDGGHRMLVFSQFTTMLDILKGELEKLGIAYYTITGSVPKDRRLSLVKEFNEGEVPVFLISLKAGGVGLNLTGADMVIHYDPWWNQAVQNQATDRAHRIGQTRKVTVYKLIAKNTIEEKIEKLQETKRDLADQVIGSQSGQLSSLTREELLELLEV